MCGFESHRGYHRKKGDSVVKVCCMIEVIENAAVFVSGRRVYKGVNVETSDDQIVVKHRVTGDVLDRFFIDAVGKAGMAWDVKDSNDSLVRLVAQQGCGCSGMKPYLNDPEYTGPFTRR
jgi:hypothetical protein